MPIMMYLLLMKWVICPFQEMERVFFQLINMRYEKKSTLITTNIPLSQWSEFLQDKKLTNALLDRLVHHSKVISITGKSYRMKDYSEKKTKTPKVNKVMGPKPTIWVAHFLHFQ